MGISSWQESNEWWRDAAKRMAGRKATDEDWEEVARQLWSLATRVDEARAINVQDRQDLVQTVILKLQYPQTLDRLANVETPAHYLAEVMKNHLLNLATRKKAAAKAIERHLQGVDLPEDTRPAAELAEEKELESLVRFYANHVATAADRKLLWGFYRDNRSIAELARELELPLKTVAMRLSRARKRMKSYLNL